MLDQNLVLKCNELFLVGDITTDGSGERATGLYARDARYLSTLKLSIDGTAPKQLAVQSENAESALVVCANPLMKLGDGTILFPQKLLVELRISLSDQLNVEVIVQHFADTPLSFTLAFGMAADFRDLFDIRGFPRAARGRLANPLFSREGVDFGYSGLDGKIAGTKVRFDREPVFSMSQIAANLTETPVPRLPSMTGFVFESECVGLREVTAEFPLTLQPRERWSLRLIAIPEPPDGVALNAGVSGDQVSPSIRTDCEPLNQALTQSLSDLDALVTTFPDGRIPAAGIPWFVAPFGRDCLITGLQTLHLSPRRAAETLRVVAGLQGNSIDAEREEEPGKILHEMRYGEMARLHEIPHSPYYGTVDATPLFVWLFAETVAWTGDRDLFETLLPNAERALEWIESDGDLDGDGLVEYRIDNEGIGRITHQVWKDSHDSLNHADGAELIGPIAAVEVQGYVYAAYAGLASVMATFGDSQRADELNAKAEKVRNLVESLFWMESEGFYAQALDGAKRQVRSISSNPGHLLMAGLPMRERAKRMIDRMADADIESGWGVRTLSTGAPSYNPMSYHNGSVWPHDNSMIGMGMFRYRQGAAGSRIAKSLLDAASSDSKRRLPELFCGFPRERSSRGNDAPVRYPVSCSPQAWAAGALPFLIRGMLGLEIDSIAGMLDVNPDFPEWLNRIELIDFSVLGVTGSLTVERTESGYQIDASGLPVRASSVN